MSINIDPQHFADLVVSANPSNSDNPEEIAKDSLELYINAYRLAERYANISTNCYDTAEVIKELSKVDINSSCSRWQRSMPNGHLALLSDSNMIHTTNFDTHRIGMKSMRRTNGRSAKTQKQRNLRKMTRLLTSMLNQRSSIAMQRLLVVCHPKKW